MPGYRAARAALAPLVFAIIATAGAYAEDDIFEDPFRIEEEQEDEEGEALDPDDFDSFFLDEEMIDVADESLMSESPQDDLLRTEGVRWGGRVRGSISSDWTWSDVWTPDFVLHEPDTNTLTPSLAADLFFDARPRTDFRAYGKLRIETTTQASPDFAITADALTGVTLPDGLTAEEDEDGNIVVRDESGTVLFTIEAEDLEQTDAPATGAPPALDISVFELFSDYTWREALFFRFGRHTIKWGTGYFFSPADVLNLTAIDAEDPTADRLGPVSLRALYPFGLTGNAYLYLITNAGAGVLDVAVAPKVEFAVGRGEVGLGAYYQRALAPRLIALSTASIDDVDLFAEAVVVWGSDRVFVSAANDGHEDLVLRTYEVDDRAFLQTTVGARYLHEWESGVSMAVIGQYFYNGEGYDGSVPGLLPAAAELLLNPTLNADYRAPNDRPEAYEAPPTLGFTDLTNWGRHYGAITASVSDLFAQGLSLSVLGLANISDRSGVLIPAIRYQFLEAFSLGLSARFTFGPEDGEFTDPSALFLGGAATPTFGLTLTLAAPGGAF